MNGRDARKGSNINLGHARVSVDLNLESSDVLVHLGINYKPDHLIPYRIESEGFTPRRDIGRVGEFRTEDGQITHVAEGEFKFRRTAGFDQGIIHVDFYHMNGPPAGRANIMIGRQPDGSYAARQI